MEANNARVLLADDDPVVLRLEQQLLESEGFQVTTVDTGEGALRTLRSLDPAAVLLDIGLPDLDGFTVCQRMRLVSQAPIILVTGRNSRADEVWGIQSGADDYITKPFLPEEFATRVKEVIERPSRRPTAGIAATQSPSVKSTVPAGPRLTRWRGESRVRLVQEKCVRLARRAARSAQPVGVRIARSRTYRRARTRAILGWRRVRQSRAYAIARQKLLELRAALREMNSPAGRARAKRDIGYLLTTLRQQSIVAARASRDWCQRSYQKLKERYASRLSGANRATPADAGSAPAPAEPPRSPLEEWTKSREFQPEAFLAVLLQAYLKVLGPSETKPLSTSPVVPLADIYSVLSPSPDRALKYLKEEFVRDVYLLHRSGFNTSRSGVQVSFPISRGVRGKNLTIVDENGSQVRYYGVRFSRSNRSATPATTVVQVTEAHRDPEPPRPTISTPTQLPDATGGAPAGGKGPHLGASQTIQATVNVNAGQSPGLPGG